MDTSNRSDEAPMTFNVVSWKGALMPEVQMPISYCAEDVIKFPPIHCVKFPLPR